MILDQPNPLADVVSPARIKPLSGAVELVKENLNVARHFVSD